MATTADRDLPQSEHLPRPPRGRIGLVVAGSLAAGLVAALALVAASFIPAKEGVLTGVVLLGFAFGWALLAVLSVRLSDQPQRWAAAPAMFFALAGLISLLPPGSVVQKVFSGNSVGRNRFLVDQRRRAGLALTGDPLESCTDTACADG